MGDQQKVQEIHKLSEQAKSRVLRYIGSRPKEEGLQQIKGPLVIGTGLSVYEQAIEGKLCSELQTSIEFNSS